MVWFNNLPVFACDAPVAPGTGPGINSEEP